MTPCERYLRRWYAVYNHRYFNGELPADIDVFFARLRRCGGDCEIDRGGEFVVRIHYRQKHYRTTKYTLLHEMVHVKLNPYGGHGPRFDEEMLRLAIAGAFHGLW